MELNKAITEITNLLDNWLKENGFDLTTRFEQDFGYYHNENVVAFGLLTTEKTENCFTTFVEDLGGYRELGFINSFFHEVGHHETYDDISDRDYEYGRMVKAYLADKEELDEYDLYTYFNLPIERTATEWAVAYINDHTPEVYDLMDKVRDIIYDIELTNIAR
jgi:hypothetical protein